MDKIEIIPGQTDRAIAIMGETARFYRERGFRIWPEEWLTREQLVTAEARPGDFCIGQVEGEDACAFIVQRRDSQYWSGAAQGEAVYLHKFCVRPDFSHRGMTQSVVEALRALCRDQGIRYIRLDTGLDEKAVRKIYLRAGFKIVDIIDYDNGRSLALYELEV